MSVKNCIQNYDPKLVSQFEAMVESGLNEYEAAREIILSSHKTMFDELNAIKKDAGIKEEKYTDPQKTDVKPVKESAEIKKQKKKEEAQKKAEEKKAESEKQRKLREEKKAQEKKEKEEARKKEKEDKAEKKKKEQEEKKEEKKNKSKQEEISSVSKRYGISEKAAEKIVAAKQNLKEPRTLLDEIRKILLDEAKSQATGQVAGELGVARSDIERRRQEELNIEQLPIDRVKRKNGAIGTQGVTTDQVASILKNVLGLTIPENATMKDLVNLFISDKANIDKLLEFTNLNPINITELPDGTIQINDGHHRAFLLDQAGITELPITRNNSEQINAKYDAELSALEKSTAQSTVTKVHGTSTGRDPGVVSPQDEDIAGVEDYQGILAATADIDGRQQKEMASSARRTVGEVRKEFEKNGNVVVSDAAMAALTGIKEVKGEGRSVNQNTYLFDILTDANASPDQRGVAAALILAHRVSSGNSFLANTFNAARKSETKGKKDGVVKIIYRPVDDASLITAHDDGSITINAYKLGRRVDEFGGENRFFSWAEMAMYEEVIHLSTFKVASTEEISQIGRELTQRERDVVESIYGSKLEKFNAETNKMEPDYYALGLEYIRMMTQTSMFGISTELLKPLYTNERSAKKTFFAKLLRFLNDIFSLSRRERVATEVMDRLDTFLGRKDKDDQYKKPEQIIAESPKYSVFASPKGQKPVYMLTYKNRQYLLQEGRTASGPAWFEVQKMQDGFFAPVNDGSFIPGYLGTTYREAIQTLLARGGKGYGVSLMEADRENKSDALLEELSKSADVQYLSGTGMFLVDNKVLVKLRDFEGRVHLEFIGAIEKGKGHGSDVISRIVNAADQKGFSIDLNAIPVGNGGIDKLKLVDFYKKAGFKVAPRYGMTDELDILEYVKEQPTESVYMVRDPKKAAPKKVENKKTKPETYEESVDKYKWFVIDLNNKRAVEGFEFNSDAKDALSDYGEGYKVYSFRGMQKLGIEDPRERWKGFGKSGVAEKLSRVKMTPGRWSGGKSQEKAALYSKAGLLFHGGEAPIAQFDGEKIKGGSRSILGWGVYFSSSPYKASDYGTTFTYIDSTKLNILDGRGPVTQEFIDQIRKAANNEKDALTKAYYSIAADKFQQQIGKDIDNARKNVSSQIQQNTDKAFSELLVKMGYDAMQEGYEFVVFNLSRTDAIVSDPDAHLESLYESGKMVDEIEGFIQDTSGYGVSKMEPQDDDDIDRLAREIFDDLMNEYSDDSDIKGDPIKEFKWVYDELNVIIQDFALTEMNRGTEIDDITLYERKAVLLKETELRMFNIVEDVFAKNTFDDAIGYVIKTLKDTSLDIDIRGQLVKIVKQKLRFTHPDIVNYINERIEAGAEGLATSAAKALMARRLMNVDETYTPEDKPKKPKRDPKQVDMDRLFKDNEASQEVMYLLEQSEDGREMVKAMKEIQRRLEKNKALKDEEVLLVDMAAGSADNLSEIEQAARQANDLVNKMYKEFTDFKEEDKEAAEQRLRSTRYQMMARRKVDNMRELAKQIKASIKQITERC